MIEVIAGVSIYALTYLIVSEKYKSIIVGRD